MEARKMTLDAGQEVCLEAPETADPVGSRPTLRNRIYRLLETGEQADLGSRLVNAFLVALILSNVMAVILASMDSFAAAYVDSLRAFELISVAVFTAEYLCRVWTSVEEAGAEGRRSPLRTRLRFLASPGALVDLVAVLPFYLVTLGMLAGVDMRILRLLRLVRLLKLARYAGSLSLLAQVLRENARNFSAAIGMLLIVMLLAATGIYLFEREAQPEDFGSIPSAMWWAFATLTTVGYGDVTPITPLGRVFGAAITVVSVGIVALPAGLLASSFSERLRQKSDKYRRLADLAVADGVVTDSESAMLERERRALGIGEDLAATIILDEQDRVVRQACCPTCGRPVA
jgi:voltage-gated potassium channel